jgi:hypothetical protein
MFMRSVKIKNKDSASTLKCEISIKFHEFAGAGNFLAGAGVFSWSQSFLAGAGGEKPGVCTALM